MRVAKTSDGKLGIRYEHNPVAGRFNEILEIFDEPGQPQLQVGDSVVAIDGVAIVDSLERALPIFGTAIDTFLVERGKKNHHDHHNHNHNQLLTVAK